MKMQLKRLLSCVLSLALLICVCSAGPVMDFLSTAVSAATIDEHVAQMTQLVSDSFDGAQPSANWTSVGGDMKIDAENEILEVGITDGKMQSLSYIFAQPTTNNIFISYKYKIESGARRQAVYVYGQNSSGKSKTVASFDINYNAISYYYNDPGTKTVKLASYAASANWHELKLLLNTTDNSVMVWLDGTYMGAAPYRDGPDMVNITSVAIAGSSFTSAPTKASYMDDAAIYEMGTSGVTEISEAPMNEGFNAADLPTDLWTYSATGTSIVERDEANGNALQLKATSAAQAQANFALPAAIATGKVKLSFDYYVSTDDATRTASTQFRLTDGSGKVSLTVDLQGEHFNNYNTDGSTATKTINVIQKGSGWHTIVFDMDLDQRNFTVTIDGNPVPTTNGTEFVHSMRNPSTAKGLKKGYFAVVGNADAAKCRTFQIDNFRIEYDATCYGLLQLKAPADLTVGRENKLVYGAIKYTVGQLLPMLSCGTPNSVISITDAEGNAKEADDRIEYNDKIVISNTVTGEQNVYTVAVEYAVEFRGIEIDHKEFFETDAVELPGESTVRAVIRNYTQEDKVVDVYGAVVGSETYDEETKTQITVPKNSYAYVKLNLTIPDNVADAELKLQVTSGGTTLCNASKPIATSQACSMPSIFSDGMVLQREANVNIFGLAPAGSKVAVTFGDYTASGVAEGGQFCVQLPQMPACNEGKELRVVITNGEVTLLEETFTDVVVGDVFYGSGQSNMAQSVKNFAGETLEEALGEVPNVRMYNATVVTSVADRVEDSWTSENPTGSATMYAIAAALRKYGAVDESVPIGYVKCACGSSYIQDWMCADDVEALNNSWTTSYIESSRGSTNERKTDYYYVLTQAVIPYTFKAAVWYQGEANATDANYDEEVKMMIETMRADFGYEIPYFIVQLPGYGERNGWDEFRLIQWNIQNIVSDTSVVVINDTGVENDIHPADKDIVGERIARQMMAKLYGRTDVAYEGPVCDVATVTGATVTVSFKNVNVEPYGGLCSLAADNSLTSFELSEDGETYVTATAAISGDTVVLTSSLTAPKYVRFGYVNTPLKSLGSDNTDSIGTYKLPCAPFVAQAQKSEGGSNKDDGYGLPEDDFPGMSYKHAYKGGYVVLKENADLIGSFLTEDLYIDLNGHTATGMIVTNGYKVYVLDSATNNYSCDGMGYFTCTDEYGKVIVPDQLYTHKDGKRYMTIETEKGYTSHRFYLGITNIRLVPGSTGFGYKAEFYADEMVQTRIQSVGYKLWVQDREPVECATKFKNTATLLLKNFNVARFGEIPVNACATMTLTDGTVLESATASYSMRQIVEIINESYSAFTEEKLAAVREMIETYPIMKTWNVDNI